MTNLIKLITNFHLFSKEGRMSRSVPCHVKYQISRFSSSKAMNNVKVTNIVYLLSKVGQRLMITYLCTFEAFPYKIPKPVVQKHFAPPHFAPQHTHTHARRPKSVYPPGAHKSHIYHLHIGKFQRIKEPSSISPYL